MVNLKLNFKLAKIDDKGVKTLFIGAIVITLAIFLLKFCLTGFGVFGDGIGYYAPLRSLLFDGDLKVLNEHEFYSQSASIFGGGVRSTGPGVEYSKYTIGMGLILLPFFAIGHLVALALGFIGVNVEANGLTWPYELFYCLGSIGLGITGLWLSYRTARHYFSPTACAIAVGGIWFASPLTYYLLIEVSMSHAVSQFLISLFLYFCITKSWQKERRLQIALGGILGMAALVRPQDVLFIIVPILIGWLGIEENLNSANSNSDKNNFSVLPPKSSNCGELSIMDSPQSWGARGAKIYDQLVTSKRQYLSAIALILVVTVLMQLPQLLIYIWQYGGLSRIPYLEEGKARGYGRSFHWFQPEIFKVLFSGYRGLFTWHPLTLLAVIGLGLLARKMTRLACILLIAVGLQVYVISAWWCWWQGASVGGRMFANCTLIFVFGLAALWDYFPGRQWKKWGIGISCFLIFWNILIMLQYQSAMIPPEDPITLSQLYQNQFKVIPFFVQRILQKIRT
jgi:hypothetical protein